MRIHLTSIFVDDQRAALAFYTDVLGFTKHHDIPLGDDFWITVVSPDCPDGPELLLEPAGHPAVKPYRDAPELGHLNRFLRTGSLCPAVMPLVSAPSRH